MKKNINLKNKDLANAKSRKGDLSTKLGVGLLGASIFALGVLVLLNYLSMEKNKNINEQINGIEGGLAQEEYLELYDFNVKLIDLESKIGQQELLPQTRNLIEISKKTLPEIDFVSLRAKNNEHFFGYEIEVKTPDNAILVKQIKAYKEMENVGNFFLNSTKEVDGQLVAKITFDLGDFEKSAEIEVGTKETF